VSLNTETVPDAPHTLTATATDGAGRTVTASRSVTVANVTPPPAKVTVALSSPRARSTVSGRLRVAVSVRGAAAGPISYTLFVDGARVKSRTAAAASTALSWNTEVVADGPHTLRVTVVDSSGKVGKASRTVTVVN
jgi:hypothetical protein